MSAKVRAGGIIRTSSDSTWRTPQLLRERIAGVYFAGVPFLDPCAPPDNPLGAARFYCGPVPGGVPTRGPLFNEPTEAEANRLDGLTEPWDLPWYANIPFSAVDEWSPKILAEVARRPRQPGLLLVPVNRTEEECVTDLFAGSWRVLFVRWPDPKTRHRIPFESSIDGAECKNNPFGSWVIGYGGEPETDRWFDAWEGLGRSFEVRPIARPEPEPDPWVKAGWACSKCGAEGAHYYRVDDGDHEDEQHRCDVCKATWWVEGSDA